MYRFGDSTAFPLQENFIDTLVGAVDCCVELFLAEGRVEAAQSSAREARRSAGEELRRLEALAGWVEDAVAPLCSGPAERPSETAAQRIGETARDLIRKARADVVARRDRDVARSRVPHLGQSIRKPLTTFLLCRELPGSQWSWRWQVEADGRGRADLRVIAGELIATFDAAGPRGTLWAGPIRVGDVAAGLRMTVPSVPRRKKQPAVSELLDGYEICVADSTRSRQRLVLRPLKGRGRLVLSLRDPEAPAPYAARLSDDDQVLGAIHELAGVDVDALRTLWSQVSDAAPSLVAARSSLQSASLSGRSIEICERPGQIAETILGMLAPLVREMRLRSRVPGELILKRDLEGDRREEIFVPRAALQERFSILPDHHRQVFEAMGLGTESTMEFRTQVEAPALREKREYRASKRRLAPPSEPRTKDEIAAVSLLASTLGTEESYGFSPRPAVRQDASESDAIEAA